MSEVAAEAAPAPLVRVDNISMRFTSKQGQVLALSDVSLAIRKSEFFALLGPSGCGKSTLLRVVSGLQRPSTGTVSVARRGMIGSKNLAAFCFQQDNLLEWRTVLGNVILPAELRHLDLTEYATRGRSLLELVGLEGFEDHYPHQLSGGMRQRVALCRALLCESSLLLMDEPFGALDALSREQHQILLQQVWMRDPITVLFVTHDIRESVFLSDRVAVMSARPGRIVEVIDIDLPRPRTPEMEASPAFNEYVARIRDLLFSSLEPVRPS